MPANGSRAGARPQAVRRAVAAGFLVFTVLVGLQFALFVGQVARSPHGVTVERPPSVEAFLPISSLVSLTYLVKAGEVNPVRPAGLIIFALSLVLALAVKRGFCSWVCPFGLLSEVAWKLGARLLGRNPRIPRGLDVPLRGLKYALLGLFLYAILPMPVEALRSFIHGPYNRVADAKMLAFFAPPGGTTLAVLGALVALSLVFENFWCRYLCPYGALLGVLSLASPFGIRRETSICTGCGRCTKACPSRIPVAARRLVRSAECTACFACVESCPVPGCLALGSRTGRLRLPALAYGVVTVLAFIVASQVARAMGTWQTDTPLPAYHALLERMGEIDHPRTVMRSPSGANIRLPRGGR